LEGESDGQLPGMTQRHGGQYPVSALTGAEESLRMGSSLPLRTWLQSKRVADAKASCHNTYVKMHFKILRTIATSGFLAALVTQISPDPCIKGDPTSKGKGKGREERGGQGRRGKGFLDPPQHPGLKPCRRPCMGVYISATWRI